MAINTNEAYFRRYLSDITQLDATPTPPPNVGPPVTSVFGRTGAIVAQSGDYSAGLVTNAVDSTQIYNNPTWIGTITYSKITGVPILVNTFNGRSGIVVPASGDYTAAQVTNAVSTIVTYADPAWITALGYAKLTGVPNFLVNPTTTKGDIVVNNGTSAARLPVGTNGQVLTANSAATNGIDWESPTSAIVSSVFGRTGAVVALAGDYTAALVTNCVSQVATYANPAWITSLAWSKLTGVPTLVNSFNTRTGAITPTTGDYTAAQVTNAADTSTTYSDPVWITALAWSKITGAPSVSSYQTPWLSAINGGGFSLSNVNNVSATTFTASAKNNLFGNAAGSAASPAQTDANIVLYNNSSTNWAGIGVDLNGHVWFRTGLSGTPSPCLFLANNGNVGIGFGVAPTHQLQLSTDDAAKLTTNTWTISSGAAVKQNVKPLTGGLEIINRLAPKEAEYNGRAGTPKGQRVVSLIAEEVQKVLPYTVTTEPDGSLGFNVHEVIFQLILAVQQLSAQVVELKKKK